MISFEEFASVVEDEIKLLPSYALEELNGGVVVREEARLHPERVADDLYILGTYSTDRIMGKQITIYYGSFVASLYNRDDDALKAQIRETLRHEVRHHMETKAGFFGEGTLIAEDKEDMRRYYLKHGINTDKEDK